MNEGIGSIVSPQPSRNEKLCGELEISLRGIDASVAIPPRTYDELHRTKPRGICGG